MKKPFWLKKSSLQYYWVNLLFSLCTIFIRPKGIKNKILITEFDGIGDLVVNQKLVDLIIKKYGEKNVIFLVRDNMVDLAILMGYEYISYEDNYHLSIFKLMKMYKKMCKYNFTELYFLEFHLGYNVNEIGCSDKEFKINFLKKFKFEKIYGYENGIFNSWKESGNVVTVNSTGKKILDKIYDYAIIVDDKVLKKDLIPDLEIEKSEKNYIAVGIGASDKIRIISPKKLAEFLNYISENSQVEFHILGYGKTQEEYYKKLEKYTKNKNVIISYVSRLSLKESVVEIANSKLYIGFDSGLYNIAYTLRKKILAITDEKICPEYRHESSNIRFVHRSNEDKLVKSDDLEYKNENLNSVSLETFIKEYRFFDFEKES